MLKNNEYYIGFSKKDDDRFRASSGGIGTAIIRHLMSLPEYGTSITFYFDTGLCKYVPKLIFSAKDINVCGSIYQDIDLIRFIRENIENIKNGIVMTCAPCQVMPIRSMLNRKGIKNFIISYSCSGQTTIEGTWCYYKFLEIDKENVKNMQYRGNGWPSGIQIWLKDGNVVKKNNWTEPWISIHQSNLFKPKRCLFCKLDMGHQADINIADPWLERYKKTETKGATLCVICSEYGKQVFNEMITSKEIEVVPSTYDDYSIAESPNIHKEILLQREKKYRKRLSKLLDVKVYRWWATKSLRNMTLAIKFHNLIRLCSREINLKYDIPKLVNKIKQKNKLFIIRKD